MTRLLGAIVLVLATVTTTLAQVLGEPLSRRGGVPPLQHVFVIIEENMSFEEVTVTHGDEAPYLNALAAAHVRHEAYYATAHPSLGNYTAMISGQVPLPAEARNCPRYSNCIRPGPTLAAQLDAKRRSWRGYFESMPFPCARPTGFLDNYSYGYATRHNPFVYFGEIVDDAPYCEAHVVPYEKNFAKDLATSPPTLAFIVPDTCNDGHDAGCKSGKTALEVLDGWLEKNVPPILKFVYANPGSVLIITFDESESDDRRACCNQRANRGGGRIDFVMIAPGLERAPGHRSKVPGNHYSLLRTLQEGFGLAPLGESARVKPMTDLFVR
jgi:phosphatidylinositol-3-phosphatase